jgi:hypothetical protein
MFPRLCLTLPLRGRLSIEGAKKPGSERFAAGPWIVLIVLLRAVASRGRKHHISRSEKLTSVSTKPVSRTRLQSPLPPPAPPLVSAARWHSMQLVA